MNKTHEQLEQEHEAVEVKLHQYQHRAQRMRNRRQYYEKGERQRRAHRLITRGAAVESVAPDVKPMTETAFYFLVEHIFSMPEVIAAVKEAVEKEDQ